MNYFKNVASNQNMLNQMMARVVMAVEATSPDIINKIFSDCGVHPRDYLAAYNHLTTGCMIGGYRFSDDRLNKLKTLINPRPNRDEFNRAARLIARQFCRNAEKDGYDDLFIIRVAGELIEYVNGKSINCFLKEK